jgi:hypothetical protein
MGLTYIGSSRVVIDSPGDYTIDRDMTQADPLQHCVTINPGVHYVTLRLRSRLVGAGGVNSNNAGIYANGNAAVSLIGDGGSIRGFAYGVQFYNTLIARMNGLFVQDALFRGIKIEGDDAMISNCDIREVHGAMWTPSAYCMGIECSGMTSGNGKPKVLNNFVQNVYGTNSGGNTGESVGISITDLGIGAVVAGNIIQNDTKPGLAFAHGATIAVWCGGASNVLIDGNVMRTWDNGIVASSPPSIAHGQNLFANCTTDFLIGGPLIPTSED